MNEKQREMFERIKGTPYMFQCDVLRKDFIDLVRLVESLDGFIDDLVYDVNALDLGSACKTIRQYGL